MRVGGNSSSGILDLEADHALIVARRFQTHLDRHIAFVGELDGVAHQVDQDLPQAEGVAPHRRRDVAVDLADEFQPFLGGLLGQQFHGILDGLPQVHVFEVEFHFSGLDLGEIQDVGNQAQQRRRGGAGDVGIAFLLGVQPGRAAGRAFR